MIRSPRAGSPHRASLAVAALAAFFVVTAACGGRGGDGASDEVTSPGAAEVSAEAEDIVLLLVAGLRADAPGEAGAEAAFFDAMPGTPDLRFTAAYAQSASPFTSLGTILTGRYASAIPMCGLWVGGAGGATERRAWCADIPPERHTLPEILGLYGYRTALVSAGAGEMEVLADEFQTWIHVPDGGAGSGTDWGELSAKTVAWWREDASRPRVRVVLAEALAGEAIPRMRNELGAEQQLRRGVFGAYEGVSDEQRQRVAEIYRASAETAGRQIGGMLTELTGAAGGRPWLTFVGSTNGVNLLESTGFSVERVYPFDNGMILDRTVHVPLAVYRSSGGETTRSVTGPCELRALFSTALERSGGALPAGMQALDLLEDGYGGEERIYTEFGDMLGLRKGEHLIVFRGFVHDGNTVDPELDRRLNAAALVDEPDHYVLSDVVADPYQATDLRTVEPALFQQLRDELIQVRTTHAAVPREALTPERLWELRMSPSQGYW